MRYSKNPLDAKDLTHDVFIKCYENFENFRGDSKVSTWLYRVAVNYGIDYLRKKKPNYLDPKQLEFLSSECQENLEQNVLTKLSFEKMLTQVNSTSREILFLYFFEKLNQVEIAELIGISRQAVKKHLDKFQKIKTPLLKQFQSILVWVALLLSQFVQPFDPNFGEKLEPTQENHEYQ